MATQLTAVVGHIEVENAAKATQDFAALRRQVEPLLGPPLEAALLTQLGAIYQQDAADLQQLSASSYAPLRTFAQAALADLQSRRTRLGA